MEDSVALSDSDDDEVKPKARRPRSKRQHSSGSDSDDDFVPPENKQKRSAKKTGSSSSSCNPRAKKVKVNPETDEVHGTKRNANLVAKQSSSRSSSSSSSSKMRLEMDWDIAEYLAELQQVHVRIAANVIQLFNEDNTIPFIARYRKELTGDLGPEKLRELKDVIDTLESVKQKAETIKKSIEKIGKLEPSLETSIRSARSISELEHIYAPFKPGSKGTKAERARQLGLEQGAMSLLHGSEMVILSRFIQPEKEGLSNEAEVSAGVQHVIADVISKDRQVLDKLWKLKDEAYITLQVSKAKVTKQKENTKLKQKTADVPENKNQSNDKSREDLERKFENYFEFLANVKTIKPHQVLAISRGENLKVLVVKVVVPDRLMENLFMFCCQQWLRRGIHYQKRTEIVELAIRDSYTRLIHPLLVRHVRTTLNHSAERAAIEVFAENLKNLLLSPPLHGKTILGLDPGFRHGCKIGIVSLTGEVIHTDIVFPRFGQVIDPRQDPNAGKIRELLLNFNCQVIALGNGTACRETETWLSHLIQCKWFSPLDVTYTIVSEQGASIYSCSPAAKKEFGEMDPNMISAVSLARRVQDPMAELVKVEPQHLGVGMYQHDVPKKQLGATLDEVVVECVSFVGVDVNTASESILRRIAGLSSARAEKILEWRATNGPFVSREQLKKVKGIGAKSFEQCAGFIRINPVMINDQRDTQIEEKKPPTKKNAPKKLKVDNFVANPLDRTWIHPESYQVTNKFLKKCGIDVENLGRTDFITAVRNTVDKTGLMTLSQELGVDEPTMKLITDGLQQAPDHDLRSQSKKPLFRRGLTSMEDLRPGTILTGRAQNVTHFGVFVDIGVGTNGLIPISKLRNMRPVQLGDHLEVKVISIELQRKRISLELVQVL